MFCRLGDNRDVCMMLGLDNAGKTTMLYKFKLGDDVETIPTIGLNCEMLSYRGREMCVWDVGGQDRIRPLWRHHLHHTGGIIWVVDSTDVERMDIAREELHRLLAYEENLARAILLIFANKQVLAA